MIIVIARPGQARPGHNGGRPYFKKQPNKLLFSTKTMVDDNRIDLLRANFYFLRNILVYPEDPIAHEKIREYKNEDEIEEAVQLGLLSKVEGGYIFNID